MESAPKFNAGITAAPAVHESVRTSISTNMDPITGQRMRLLTTSRLEMAWQAGELVIRCAVARVATCAEVEPRRARRWVRGTR